MWSLLDDGSVVDEAGKVIFFSTQRFIDDICLGNCCFICGAAPNSVPFNDEHVFPEWLLRRFDLFSKQVTLPNGQRIKYAQYKVPCCESCNSLMGREIETPISKLFRAGPAAVAKHLAARGSLKFFVWLGLIFLKTHLKDRSHRYHLDRRQGERIISDEYEWDRLHHIHTVVRCFYTRSMLMPEVIGTFLPFKVRRHPAEDQFDFADLFWPQTMLLRLGHFGFVAVFDDSQAVLHKFYRNLKKIDGRLSRLQLREVMVDLAWLNIHLKERPRFQTLWDLENEMAVIVATRPPHIELNELDFSIRGDLMHHLFRESMPLLAWGKRTQEDIKEAILGGSFTTLFNDKGEFNKHRMRRRRGPTKPGKARSHRPVC